MLGEYKILDKKSIKIVSDGSWYYVSLKKAFSFLFFFRQSHHTCTTPKELLFFKAKAREVKSYSNFQNKTIKANLQAKKVFKPWKHFI